MEPPDLSPAIAHRSTVPLDGRLTSPLDGYELLACGGGRRLERFGPYLVERPAPQHPDGPGPNRADPDWVYSGIRVGAGSWCPRHAGLPLRWPVSIDGQPMWCRPAAGGQVGIYPEHVACWRWLRVLLQGHPGTRVLNLFAATGGASLAAARMEAQVTHVDAQGRALELARLNTQGLPVRLLREDVSRFVERGLRRDDKYDVLVLDPPAFGRGPKGQTWSLSRDLPGLLAALGGLWSSRPLGLWLSTHNVGWDAEHLTQLVAETAPALCPEAWRLGVVARNGDRLDGGYAVTLEWH